MGFLVECISSRWVLFEGCTERQKRVNDALHVGLWGQVTRLCGPCMYSPVLSLTVVKEALNVAEIYGLKSERYVDRWAQLT
jgi:hypothetical protein